MEILTELKEGRIEIKKNKEKFKMKRRNVSDSQGWSGYRFGLLENRDS